MEPDICLAAGYYHSQYSLSWIPHFPRALTWVSTKSFSFRPLRRHMYIIWYRTQNATGTMTAEEIIRDWYDDSFEKTGYFYTFYSLLRIWRLKTLCGH